MGGGEKKKVKEQNSLKAVRKNGTKRLNVFIFYFDELSAIFISCRCVFQFPLLTDVYRLLPPSGPERYFPQADAEHFSPQTSLWCIPVQIFALTYATLSGTTWSFSVVAGS